MRPIIITLVLLLFGVGAQGQEVVWKNWGAAPYASSQEDACRKAPLAIDGFNMPKVVKEHFKSVLGTTCKGGTEVWLTPNQLLEQMWSDEQNPHLMNKVRVGELPVSMAPDGRSYRTGAVAETAKALVWTFVHEGKTHSLYLPFVCFNWSWAPEVAAVAEECVELSFNGPIGGQARWGVGTTTGPLPPSGCNAQKQGDGEWAAWYGECDICVPAIGYIRGIIGDSAQTPHKYLYDVTSARQTLRFSSAIQDAVVYLCLEDSAGRQTCGVYMRPQDWEGRRSVDISDSLWVWDDGNCPM